VARCLFSLTCANEDTAFHITLSDEHACFNIKSCLDSLVRSQETSLWLAHCPVLKPWQAGFTATLPIQNQSVMVGDGLEPGVCHQAIYNLTLILANSLVEFSRTEVGRS